MNSRREFLTKISKAVALNRLSGFMLASIFSTGAFSKSNSLQNKVSSKRHITIFFPGAPSRWMFDLFLDHRGSSKFDPTLNPMLGTKLKEAGSKNYEDIEFKSFLLKEDNLHLPWLWQFPVGSEDGRGRKLTDLLKHLTAIQGMNTHNGSHFGSQQSHFSYKSRQKSLSALSIDGSEKFFSGISLLPGGLPYSSHSDHKPLQLNSGLNKDYNLIASLAEPFSSLTEDQKWSNNLRDQFQKTLKILDQHAVRKNMIGQSLIESRSTSKELLEKIFSGNFKEIWFKKYEKYEYIISQTLDWKNGFGKMTGVNDRAIGSRNRGHSYAFGGIETLIKNEDIRTLIDPLKTYPKFMASHFAVTEFIIENDLSNMVCIAPGPFANLIDENGKSRGENSHTFDEHGVGSIPALIINSAYHRAVGACLLEFFDFLKEKNEFNNTVIDFGSEFNRAPRFDQGGSDHGWTAKSTNIYSGAITNGPFILGNMKSSSSAMSPGPWGEGAPTKKVSGKESIDIGIDHLHSTVAYLLGVQSPFPNVESLLVTSPSDSSKMLPTVEESRLI